MYIDMFPSVFETIPAICFNVRESDTSDTWIRHVSLLLLLFINAYEAKCDRVIENLGKTIKRNRPFLVVFNILRSESTAII